MSRVRCNLVWLVLLGFLVGGMAAAAPVHLESTFFYDGDITRYPYTPLTIAVDSDGTVAVAINRQIGAGNIPAANGLGSMVLLYDKTGEPIGVLHGQTSGMVDVTFGPDHRVYTAESWFGSGLHVYDRPGALNRLVPTRWLRADGSHVDFGTAQSIAVGPDLRLWNLQSRDGKVHVLSPEDKNLLTLDPPPGVGPRIKIAPDNTVFMGNYQLGADNKWSKFPYSVLDVRSDGKLLVALPDGQLGRYDRGSGQIEARYPLPPEAWGDFALGPDNNVYLTPQSGRREARDAGLAYIVIEPGGRIALTRGSDFDRLVVELPDTMLTAGAETSLTATTERSRDLGYVPRSGMLPGDNRALLTLRAWVTPVVVDPLAPVVWTPVSCLPQETAKGDTGAKPPYLLRVPPDLFGSYRIRFTAGRVLPGLDPLQVSTEVTIRPAGATAMLTPATDRGRIGFVRGEAIRIPVVVEALETTRLTGARLALLLPDGREVWHAPLGLGPLTAGSTATPVVVVPSSVSRILPSSLYRAQVVGLPAGAGSAYALVQIVDPVPDSDFLTLMHPIGTGNQTVADARLHAELGANRVVIPGGAPNANVPAYLDAATRLGLTAQFQPYGHFAALNTMPEEQGAMRHFFAATAQMFRNYPSFAGFNYHDLWAPFGTWWDTVRDTREKALWKEWAAKIPIPAEVPDARRDLYQTAMARAQTLRPVYQDWNDAIKHADPRLIGSTMQWWHLDWTHANPDTVAENQDVIATQHMEEQFFHPVTIADQIEDWRRPGKPLYCYGNTDWQDDGTGGQDFRDLMTALSRGVQGAGRNELPGAGQLWTERVFRGAAPALKLARIYGGISAHSHPVDQVAVWRSLYAMALEQPARHPYRQHFWQTSTAFNACLYAHRTAAIITDGKVRAGGLQAYKAVIVSFEQPLPPDLMKPLQEFQKAGGLVLANKPVDGYWCPPGAVELGQVFTDSHACYDKNDDLARWLDMQHGEGTMGAKVIRDALAGKVQPMVDTGNPATWLSVLKSGETRYIMAVNLNLLPQPWEDLHRYAGYENTTFPVKVPLDLIGVRGAVYDVLNGRRLHPVAEETGVQQVDADMTIFPGAILAITPQPITEVRLAGGQSADLASLRLVAKVVDAKGNLVDGAIPLHILVTDAAGQVRYDLHRTAVGGHWDEVLPLDGEADGTWTVVVQELFNGATTQARMKLQSPAGFATTTPFSPTPVEWIRPQEARDALQKAHTIGLVIGAGQLPALAPAVTTVLQALGQRKVIQVTEDAYLADRKALGWEKFVPGETYRPNLQLRPKRYDLILALSTPAQPSAVIEPALLPLKPTAQDPGPGRGVVQFIAMPVYDTEDALALNAGDLAGLVAAAKSLGQPPATTSPAAPLKPSVRPLTGYQTAPEDRDLPGSPPGGLTKAGLRGTVGIPVGQVAGSADGQRIGVALKGWGNNFFVLDETGRVLHGDVAGKFFPLDLAAAADGFWLTSYENDPTVTYRKHYDRDGHATLRLAANGRRLGGARDYSASHPIVQGRFEPQASFSLSADGHYAAVGGSRGIAVWDLPARRILWRDDAVAHTVPLSQKADVAPDASMFPQVRLAPDGAALLLQHHNRILLRGGMNGQEREEQKLPEGTAQGRARVFDGHTLVVGDTDFFAFRDGQPIWHWKAPRDVTATAFAPDGMHFAIGEPDGTVRMLDGGGQIGGYVAPAGGIDSLALSNDASRLAFSTSTGWVGVLDNTGQVIWQKNLGGTRAQIAFLGQDGTTVTGDWKGRVSRYDARGQERWTVDLTPKVYRGDMVKMLTTADATPTLRIPPPVVDQDAPLNLDLKVVPQNVTYIQAGGWHGPVEAQWPGTVLMDGKRELLSKPWFSRDGAYWLAGAPAAPAFELAFQDPVRLNALLVTEDPNHPEAVPQEIKLEAWVNDNWQTVARDLWVQGTTHSHRFTPVTTTRLRYTVMGDLYHNLWTTELEAYKAP